LKHLFRNKANIKLMRWHKEEHKKDNMSRHPDGAGGDQLTQHFRTLEDTQGT
jgi:hypothetical protein